MKKKEKKLGKGTNVAKAIESGKESSECNDPKCNIHGNLKTRGRVFEGTVISKFPKRVAIEFERVVYVRKYERYKKSKTRIHARLPDCKSKDINLGDYIRVQECRPLSKMIHTIVLGKVNGASGEVK